MPAQHGLLCQHPTPPIFHLVSQDTALMQSLYLLLLSGTTWTLITQVPWHHSLNGCTVGLHLCLNTRFDASRCSVFLNLLCPLKPNLVWFHFLGVNCLWILLTHIIWSNHQMCLSLQPSPLYSEPRGQKRNTTQWGGLCGAAKTSSKAWETLIFALRWL